MPGFDGTGPAGRGSGTGGGFGICGAGRLGLRNPRSGRWFGRGAGRFYRGAMATRGYEMPGPEEEKAVLKMQADQLKADLAETERRIAELEE